MSNQQQASVSLYAAYLSVSEQSDKIPCFTVHIGITNIGKKTIGKLEFSLIPLDDRGDCVKCRRNARYGSAFNYEEKLPAGWSQELIYPDAWISSDLVHFIVHSITVTYEDGTSEILRSPADSEEGNEGNRFDIAEDFIEFSPDLPIPPLPIRLFYIGKGFMMNLFQRRKGQKLQYKKTSKHTK